LPLKKRLYVACHALLTISVGGRMMRQNMTRATRATEFDGALYAKLAEIGLQRADLKRLMEIKRLIESGREAFSVREFCARYGICRQTFYDEIRRGRLKAVKLGAKTIVLKADADSWAASLPVIKLSAATA
jgi:predicted DNA-binding transcriptional regulator AlpA